MSTAGGLRERLRLREPEDATMAPAPGGGGGGFPDGAKAAMISSLLPLGLDAKLRKMSFSPEPFACMCLIAFPKFAPRVCI